MTDDVVWSPNGPDGSMTMKYAILYDANPTIGEETTVTVVHNDGSAESFTHIAELDEGDDVPSVKPFFTSEQIANFDDDTTFRVSMRTDDHDR